jgi:GNAT superfamily N-acetyltransferase
MIDARKISIVQDMDLAIAVMRDCGTWLLASGKRPNKWWQLTNLNREFLLKHTKPDEYYVFLVDGKPAASEILQTYADDPGWKIIDGNDPQPALYVHWFSVRRDFAGQGFSKRLVELAQKKAKELGLPQLRLETNAAEPKLRKLYEGLGFTLVTELRQDYRTSAFYHKRVTA